MLLIGLWVGIKTTDSPEIQDYPKNAPTPQHNLNKICYTKINTTMY